MERAVSSVEYRPYTRKDEEQIVDLLALAMYGREFPDLRGYWRWKHVDCPFGESFGLVAVDQGRIVGLRVFMRWDLRAGDRVYRAGRAVDTATHPDWRRRGFFEDMTRILVDGLVRDGFDLTFNTPNQLSLPGYLKMGWAEAGRLPLRVKMRRPWRLTGVALHRSAPTASTEFGGEVDNRDVLRLLRNPAVVGLVEKVAAAEAAADRGPSGAAGGLHTVISPAYLEWHYGLNRWYGYDAAFESRGDSAALVIGRPRKRGGLVELLVSEVVTLPDDRSRRLAVRAAGRLARQTSADYSAVSALTEPLGPRHGYLPVGPRGTNVTVCALRPDLAVDPADYSYWTASMGDLELF